MKFFQNTLNTRPIIKNSLKYIRSDVPVNVTEDEKDWLLSNNITTIVDLRTEEERQKKRCALIDDHRFSYYTVPIFGGDKVPLTTDDVSKSYIAMVDAQFDTLIEFLLDSKSNVLYFCNAGKDRTGVVSAALLYKLGMSYEYIVEDYMKSKANLEAFLKGFHDIDINVITPQRRYIEEFIQWYTN